MGRANQSGEAWLDARPEPAEAARQLLTAGASMEPRPCWLNAGGGKITYEYTSARAAIHEIALQEKVPREPGADYPFCVK